ncbi:MAG TPA: SusC/RagA family TonB-linked outer membrane protein [Puia sp.]|nr:SusC/RagA family TonB-linked outer membrane protein [Puia sp.]
MKLTFLLIFVALLQVSANVNGQAKISLKVSRVEISRALNTIEKQSFYRFLYNSRLKAIQQRVSMNVTDTEIKDVLNQLFTGTDLTYRILENNLIVVLSSTLVLQDIKVTGKVTGDNNEGLSGVSVSLKGTSVGTTTDNGGNFTLTVPEKGTLVVSYIGYVSQQVPVNSKSVINVKLTASNKVMDEVVVIGYGTASKRDLTGSIVKVDGKEVADKPNTNPIASLQGKVAGLSVVNNGTPGMAPDIRIRGTVSIGQVHPLYVVDGILEDNIDYINPNDIESIEVLKDPSSLAIFGVRGATGAIAITTKKAKAGQTIINFNTAFGAKKLVDKIKFVNSDQFKLLFAEENANNGITTPYDYTGLTANTDWIDAVTRVGHYNANNLSVSGSSDRNSFNFGLGYTTDEGIIKHEVLKKLLLSFTDEVKISKAIKLGVTLHSSRTDNPYDVHDYVDGHADMLDAARKVVPMVSSGTKPFRIKNPYGTDTITENLYSGLNVGLQTSGVNNPLLQLENEWDKTSNIEYRNVGSVYADISFLRHFNFRTTLYADMSTVNVRQYTPLYEAYNPVNNTPYLYSQTTKVKEDDKTYKKYQQDYILNYKQSFGEHSITATGGFTTYYFGNFNRTGNSSQGSDPTALPIPDDSRFWYVSNGFQDATTTSSSSSQIEYTTVSYLGRLLYNYAGKYYINASFRDDASSRIPEKNRHQQFWAVGGAWEISKEDFMASTTHIFDFIKLKGSIGVLGNQSASKLDGTTLDYPFYPRLVAGSNAVFGTTIYTAANQEYLTNPNLKWETVSAQEGGVELNAFKNRLHFEANYFNKTTKNLMTFVDRSSLGLPSKLENGGSIRNFGEEFSAMWNQIISKDLSVNIGGNITFLQNTVLSLSADLPSGKLDRASQNNGTADSRTEPGKPIGYFYGYQVQGLYQSYADILNSPNAASLGSYRPGDFKFRDRTGAGAKGGPDGKVTADDKTDIGNPTPKFTYGAAININYKGFSLGVDVGGVYGNSIFRTWGSLESPFQRVNYSAEKLGRWHGAGTSNWVPIISQADRFNYNGSSYNIEDGSYFRIRNLQLAYSFGKTMLSRASIKNLRLFANVQNLKTWKHNLGYSPEYGGDATSFGYDNGGGAIPMISTVGLNVTF